MIGRLEGKVTIVTGAARGIGAACAEVLSREAATVVLTDVLAEQGAATAARLRDGGGKAVFHRHDVTSEAEWKVLVDSVVAEHGRLDVLVNNAGITMPRSIEDGTVQELETVLRINFIGTFIGMQQAIRVMKGGGGAIVNVASNSTRNVLSLTALYSPTKAAVANLSKAAALHCAAQGYGIRINSVHPGITDTDMITGGQAKAIDIPQVRALADRTPFGRMAQASEIAEVVAFLASDAASYVSAEEFFVDAGMTRALLT